MNNAQVRKKIYGSPETPGVYLMKDPGGKILYVGKAKSLRKRLCSYLRPDLTAKTGVLMGKVDDVDYILCATEALALLKEAELIKKHHPQYNISLRDDKSYPMVKITAEEYPAVCITRKKDDPKASYYGPYTSGSLLREALKVIRKIFPYRTCAKMPGQTCLYYRIGLSPGACERKIGPAAYRKIIKQISMVLQGRTDELVAELSRKMRSASSAQNFEEAAKLRDKILALSSLGEQASPLPQNALSDLQAALELKGLPLCIEAFDVSNIYGTEAVASMVSFYEGQPDKDNYRRFRIRLVNQIDDYGMLMEAVRRRYQRLKDENKPFPDLILVDGGRGHLFSALKVLNELGVNVPAAGIAKEHEYIYTVNSPRPVNFSRYKAGLNMLCRIRDEAHRFALAYHHVLRRKKVIGK